MNETIEKNSPLIPEKMLQYQYKNFQKPRETPRKNNMFENLKSRTLAFFIIILESIYYSIIIAIAYFFLPLIFVFALIMWYPFGEDENENKNLIKTISMYIIFGVMVICSALAGMGLWICVLWILDFLSPFIYPENIIVVLGAFVFLGCIYHVIFIRSIFLHKWKRKILLRTGCVDRSFEKIVVQRDVPYVIAKAPNNEVRVYILQHKKIQKIYSAPMLEKHIPMLKQHFSIYNTIILATADFCYIHATINNQFYLWKNQRLLIKADSKEIWVKDKQIATHEIKNVCVYISKTSITRSLRLSLQNYNITLISQKQFSPVFDMFYDELEFVADSSWLYEIANTLAKILSVGYENQDMGRG